MFNAIYACAQRGNFLKDSISLCIGDSSVMEIRQQLENTTSVIWNTPDGIIANTKRIKATRAGKYYVKVSSPQFPAPLYDSSYVMIYSRPKSQLRDTVICKGKPVTLDARNPGMRYLWNTLETAQKIRIEAPGKYWVKIMNGSCRMVDTVNVKMLQNSPAVVSSDMSFCIGEENKVIGVKVGPGTKVLWNTGATTPNIYVTREGVYWVKTQNSNCGPQVDTIRVKLKVCECEMIIPNSFTPNEDNRNDYFFPVMQCDYSFFALSITDRWGNTVYTSNNQNAKWDGRFKGNLCPEDIYIYRIESTEKGTDKKQVRNGHISLFR